LIGFEWITYLLQQYFVCIVLNFFEVV